MADARMFTDYRTATTREEINKSKNNIVRDDDYKLFLQKNAEVIIDKEWYNYKNAYAVKNINCIHNYQTSVNPKTFYDERTKYDSLKNTKVNLYPCKQMYDYRMTQTLGTKN